MRYLLFILALFAPSIVFGAGLTLTQGGLGTTTVPANYVLMGLNTLRVTAQATSTLGLESILSFSSGLTRTGNAVVCDDATSAAEGCLTTALFSSFNSRLSTTTLGLFDKGYFFSTTSTDYWKTQQTFTGASTTILSDSNTWSGVNNFTTAATSTFSGNVQVTGNLRVDGAFYAPVTIVSSGNTTINGTLNVTGATTLATSLTGILKGTSGLVSVATAGTDYENPLTFTYPLQRTTNTISLAFGTTTANTWSSTQTFSTSPVFSTVANSVLAANSTGTLTGTSTPTASVFYATSTTASSKFPYASSTAMTVSGTMFADRLVVTSASTTYLTVNLTQIIGDGSGLSLVTPTRGFSASYSTTTTWTGTTTVRFGIPPFGLTVNTAWCSTNTGTLNVKVTHGATNMQMVRASSTIGQQLVSSNNTVVKGTLITVDFGTPASSPTDVNCTFSGPQTSQ